MHKPQFAEKSRSAEIERCLAKISRAKRHAQATRSQVIRELDYSAIRSYEERIRELGRRNRGLEREAPKAPDRETARQVGFGLWAWSSEEKMEKENRKGKTEWSKKEDSEREHVLLLTPHQFEKGVCTVCLLPKFIANPSMCAGPQLPGV